MSNDIKDLPEAFEPQIAANEAIIKSGVEKRGATVSAAVQKGLEKAEIMGEKNTAEVVQAVKVIDPEFIPNKETYEVARAHREVERALEGRELSIHADKLNESETKENKPIQVQPSTTDLEDELARLLNETRARINLLHASSDVSRSIKAMG